jgi:phage baseplate assembly protein W
MAIVDKTKKPYIADENENVFIGLNLPIHKSNGPEGYFDSSVTTIDAVKNNIKMLLNTAKGERLMQPELGMNLRDYLFEQWDDDLKLEIEADISQTVGLWLPFVKIKKLYIDMDEKNTLLINLEFHITRDPNTLASVQVAIGGGILEEGEF